MKENEINIIKISKGLKSSVFKKLWKATGRK